MVFGKKLGQLPNFLAKLFNEGKLNWKGSSFLGGSSTATATGEKIVLFCDRGRSFVLCRLIVIGE